MRTALVILAGVALATMLWGSGAEAGDYHVTGKLFCTQCHTMHHSTGYESGEWSFTADMGPSPVAHLLRDEVNDMCLSCHDSNSGAPDVYKTNSGNSPSDIRLAGSLERDSTDGENHHGHTLGSITTAPGGTWTPDATEGLICTDCHAQHGHQSTYRNLRAATYPAVAPSDKIDAAVGTNDLTKDVFERTNAEYDESQVDWNEPDNTQSALGRFCKRCHNDFHGTVGGTEIGGDATGNFIRHPAAGVNIGALTGGRSSLSTFNGDASKVNYVKVMTETGKWNPGNKPLVAADGPTPTCISCHKGHGNGNPYGLIYRQGTGTLTENGDSGGTTVVNLCKQCHVQG